MVIRKTVVALAAVMSISGAHAGGGGGFSGGATELTQLANNAELVSIYASEIQQVAQQLQMIQNMVQNTSQLPIQMWSSVESNLVSLVNALTSVNGVVNATEDALAMTQQQFGNGDLLNNYEQRLRSWNQGVNNQIGTALRNMGLNAGQFQSRQQALAQIQAASQSATGRMQVLQAGNQIAGLMVNELQSLHGTIISAEQARLNAIAVEENRKYQERQALRKFLQAPVRGGF
jgi:P-type conjugative transfer protein TrbJ